MPVSNGRRQLAILIDPSIFDRLKDAHKRDAARRTRAGERRILFNEWAAEALIEGAGIRRARRCRVCKRRYAGGAADPTLCTASQCIEAGGA